MQATFIFSCAVASNGSATDLTVDTSGFSTDFQRVFFSQEGRVFLGGRNTTSGSQIGNRYYDTVADEIVQTNAYGWSNNDNSYSAGLWACYDSVCLWVCCGKTNYGTPLVSTLSILRPPCNWLSTINNLNNTITKTGTQTMKITYTLTLYRE